MTSRSLALAALLALAAPSTPGPWRPEAGPAPRAAATPEQPAPTATAAPAPFARRTTATFTGPPFDWARPGRSLQLR